MLYQFSNYTVDTINFSLKSGETVVDCEPKVFDLIVYLIKNHQRLVSRDELFEKIWQGREVSDTSLSNHIKTARRLLGDNGQSQSVIKTTPRRGYQFIAQLKSEPTQPPTKKSIPANGVYLFVVTVLIVALATLTIKNSTAPEDKLSATDNNYLVAVLPFLNTKPNIQSDFLGLAIADRVISELAYKEHINVRPTSSIRKYAGGNYDHQRVGKELKVDYLLTGNYLSGQNRIRLNIELIEARTHNLIWRSQQIEVNNDNTFQLQDIVTQRILEGLELKLPSENQFISSKPSPANSAAYELYLRSIAQPFSTEGHQIAIELLKESLHHDDQYAPTYVQLGNRIRRLEQFGLVNTGESHDTLGYYQKALSLDDKLLSALSHLAFAYTESNRIDEAMELVIRMLAINPTNAQTRFTLGYVYRYAGLTEKAIEEMEHAVRLDPQNRRFRTLVSTYAGMGMFDKAFAQLDHYPKSAFTIGWQGLLNIRIAEREKALAHFNHLIESDPSGLWGLVSRVHKAYLVDNFEPGLVAVHQLEQTNIADAETIYYVAVYYCMLNDNKRCLQSFKKSVDSGYYNYQFIDHSPYWEKVKSNPDFLRSYNKAKRESQKFAETFVKKADQYPLALQ